MAAQPLSKWVDNAACANHPNRDWWFSTNKTETRKAIRICEQCPVKTDCSLEAQSQEFPPVGVWAGRRWRGNHHNKHPELAGAILMLRAGHPVPKVTKRYRTINPNTISNVSRRLKKWPNGVPCNNCGDPIWTGDDTRITCSRPCQNELNKTKLNQ